MKTFNIYIMPIEIGQNLIERYKEANKITKEQGEFMLRIIKLVYQAFPDLDDLNTNTNGFIRCTVLAEAVELTTWDGVRSFYFKTPTTAFYYQYQMGRPDDIYTEEAKEFSLFTDEEILKNLKRKQFPRKDSVEP